MRFVISLLNYRPGQIGGTETYLRKLVAGLDALCAAAGDELVLVSRAGDIDDFDAPRARRVTLTLTDRQLVIQRCLEALTPWRAKSIERVFTDIHADAALFPQQSIFPKAYAGPIAMTVHDVQHLVLPANISKAERLFRWASYPRSLRTADRLLAISEYTKSTVVEHCGINASKLTVILHGIDPAAALEQIQPWNPADKPFVYYPAASHPHKNHAALLRSIAALRKEGRWQHHLVLSGKRTAHWQTLEALLTSSGLSDLVTHVGFVSFGKVQQLYQAADTVVFPTQFEGFGLPVLEAAQFGKRLITSRLEVFEEIGVPRENQIDFDKPDQFARAMTLPSPTVLTHQPITWAEHARRVHALLHELAGQ